MNLKIDTHTQKNYFVTESVTFSVFVNYSLLIKWSHLSNTNDWKSEQFSITDLGLN